MRYYNYGISGDSALIEEKSKVKLRDYSYDCPIAAVNEYMRKNLKNGVTFFIYREEENLLRCAFSFDERRGSFQDAFEHASCLLSDAFSLRRIKAEPQEVTMFHFYEGIREANRRDYGCRGIRMLESCNIWIDQYYYGEMNLPYTFEEQIIPLKPARDYGQMLDASFARELELIQTQENDSVHSGNMVHYVISARSMEAAEKMTEMLMHRLYQAGRISSRRMEIISDIHPELYGRSNNHLEDIIENNYGGAIVFDLTEKFGFEPSEYATTSRYIENLLKRYKNNCLFVFVYNMNQPGFSYYVLQNLRRYVLSVPLREGKGSRKEAVKYLKSLIKGSEYAAYAGQAPEFMKQFPGDDFSMSEVLEAFGKFEPWCLARNVMPGYGNLLSHDYMADRDERAESAYEKLQGLIGLKAVKEKIDRILAAQVVRKERARRSGKAENGAPMHMVFAGNPGTAKTTVAKLLGGIGKEKGLLKSGIFVERGGMDFSASWQVREAFQAAMGGVLFIDEAYSMVFPPVIAAFVQEIENKRDEVLVILAGYEKEMQGFMEQNDGLKSRIPYWVDFPDYTEEEMLEIFRYMVRERNFEMTEEAEWEARSVLKRARCLENFGNGRYVRNLVENVIENQAIRLMRSGKDPETIRKKELFLLVKEDIRQLQAGLGDARPAGVAAKELEEMIGLAGVKNIIRKAIAMNKINRLRMKRGLANQMPSMHMLFTGRPGTAKTTVARLFGEIMRDEEVLASGHFVEVGRADLVGMFAGQTAPMVKKRFSEAIGGVLFIDETYSLCDGFSGGYGDEAISTIVQEMENHREDVIVIFAGYPEPMREFVERNPGMNSRIAFTVPFEDYSTDELCEIAALMAKKQNLAITEEAMEKIRTGLEIAQNEPDFGNGRTVRKMLEEAQMNLSERLMTMKESEITKDILTRLEADDIPEVEPRKRMSKVTIGFSA